MKKATERKIMLAIAEGNPHHFKAIDIASALGVSRAWVSAAVKDFVSEGLLVRSDDKILSLTTKGQKEMVEFVRQYQKLALAIVSAVRVSPREARRIARRLLEGTY